MTAETPTVENSTLRVQRHRGRARSEALARLDARLDRCPQDGSWRLDATCHTCPQDDPAGRPPAPPAREDP